MRVLHTRGGVWIPYARGCRLNKEAQPNRSAEQERIDELVRELAAVQEKLEDVTAERLNTVNELQDVINQVEASYEEMKAANEQLVAVQNDLRKVNAELTELLKWIDKPLVLVDMDLRIRQITRGAVEILGLTRQDIGKPVREIKVKADDSNLDQLCIDVLTGLHRREGKIQARNGRSYRVDVEPYSTEEHTIGGVVLLLTEEQDSRVKTAFLQA